MNKYLVKIASHLESNSKDPNQWKKDAFGVGTLMAAGGVGSLLAETIQKKGLVGTPKGWKTLALGGGLGAVGDYASLKINDAFNKRIDNK